MRAATVLSMVTGKAAAVSFMVLYAPTGRDRRPAGINQRAIGGSGAAAYLPEPPRGDGEGMGRTAWRPVLRLFIRTLVVILKNNALFIS